MFLLSAYLHCTWYIKNTQVYFSFLIVCNEFHVARMQTIFCRSCPYRIKSTVGLLSEFKRQKMKPSLPLKNDRGVNFSTTHTHEVPGLQNCSLSDLWTVVCNCKSRKFFPLAIAQKLCRARHTKMFWRCLKSTIVSSKSTSKCHWRVLLLSRK